MNRRFLLSLVLQGVHNRSYKGVSCKSDTGGNYSLGSLSLNGPEQSTHIFINAVNVNYGVIINPSSLTVKSEDSPIHCNPEPKVLIKGRIRSYPLCIILPRASFWVSGLRVSKTHATSIRYVRLRCEIPLPPIVPAPHVTQDQSAVESFFWPP